MTDQMKDVLGMELSQALSLLEGLPCRVEETDPRSREAVVGPLRVIRQLSTEEGILLVVCRVPEYKSAETADC